MAVTGLLVLLWLAAQVALTVEQRPADAWGDHGLLPAFAWLAPAQAWTLTLVYACMGGVAIACVQRLRHGDRTAPASAWLPMPWVGAVMAILGVHAASWLHTSSQPSVGYLVLGAIGVIATAALLAVPRGPGRRMAWTVAALALASMAVGFASQASDAGGGAAQLAGGILNALRAAVLGYAVLDLGAVPGTEAPRAAHRGTAAVIGLGLMAMIAQVLGPVLGQGNEWLSLGLSGGLAGAAAVGVRPLERLASRGRTSAAPMADADAALSYRRQVEAAWTDGRLSPKDKVVLAEARRGLGLDAETAAAIDEDVALAQVARPRAGRGGRARRRP